MGFDVETLISSAQKNVFRNDLSHKDLKILWDEMQIQGKKKLLRISTFHLEMKITFIF